MLLLALLAALAAGAGAVEVSTGPASLPGVQKAAAPAPAPADPAAAAARADLGRRALNFLAARAEDPDPDVRSAVAAAWGDLGNDKVLPLLLKAAKDRDEFVRIEAAVSLQRLGAERGREILLDIVLSSAAPKGKLTPAKEMKALAHTKARARALVRLSDMGTDLIVAVMEQTLLDRSGAVRDATAVALCRLGLGDEPPVAAVVKQFLAAAKDKDEAVRAAAVKALGDTGLARVRDALVAAAVDPSASVRAEAMSALAAAADESLAPIFIERLQDESPRVQYLASGGLAGIAGDPAATPVLRRLAEDLKTPALALRAMAGLANRSEKVDLDLAERSLGAKDIDGRMLALEVISAVPGEPSLELLRRVMQEDASPRVRVAAAAMLVKRLQRRASP